MAINKKGKLFEQVNRDALFNKLQQETQKRDTPTQAILRFPRSDQPLAPQTRPYNPKEPSKPIPMPIPLQQPYYPKEPTKPEQLPYTPEKPKLVMPRIPDGFDDWRDKLKIPGATHDDGFYISPKPMIPTKPKLAPELPHNLPDSFPDDIDPAITERIPWLKTPLNPSDALKTNSEIPQAEVDETQKIVVDWFEDAKLPEAFAKKLAEIMSKPEHSPFETAPIKVDTGSEIVRDWYEDEPEQLLDYYKAQAEPILQRLTSGSDINNNQQKPTLVSVDKLSGMHESQAHSAGIWAGYGNDWVDGWPQSSAKSPFSEATNLNYGDTGNYTLRELQKVLYENGFYGDDMPTTGNFDATTLKAVIRFQLASNMNWDDLFDANGKYKGVDSKTLMNLEHLYLTSTDANKNMRRDKIGGMISSGGLFGDPLENLTIHGTNVKNKTYSIDKSTLTEEEKVFIATIAGEAIGQGALAWEAVANVIMNRIGDKEWAKYTNATDIIKYTGFDGYNSREYEKMINYLSSPTDNNEVYDELIRIAMEVYYGDVDDITNGAQLFYSPRSMSNGSSPSWNFSLLSEVIIDGILSNDFRFYTYK